MNFVVMKFRLWTRTGDARAAVNIIGLIKGVIVRNCISKRGIKNRGSEMMKYV